MDREFPGMAKRDPGDAGNRFQLRPPVERLILVFLCTILFGQLLFSSRRLSQTDDEATHLYSGYRYLQCGDLTVSPEHPPLAKIVAAIPLLATKPAVNCSPFKGDDITQAISGLKWLYGQDWRSALVRARIAVSVFAVGLCLLVWSMARRMFDLATAATATTLLIFEPNVLAFGALVMTDVPVTCMLLLTVYGSYLWVNHRTAPYLFLTGLATGLTLLAKHSGVAIVPILCVLAVADAVIGQASPRSVLQAAMRNLAAVALVCVIAFGVVWAGYGMRFAAHPGSVQFQDGQTRTTSSSARMLLTMKKYRLFPEAYLEGFIAAMSISSQVGPAFVAGRVYLHAPWFSTPLNLLIRSSTASVVMLLASIYPVVIAFRQRRRELCFVLIPAGVFLAVCLRSSVSVGVRYLLPIFPFVLIAVGAGCVELARRVPWIRYALPCLVLLHVASSLHAYPNYLSYANEFWGGPAEAYRYMPWVDIGQANFEANTYLEQHPVTNCWYITGWQWDPRLYGIPCQTFGIYLPNQMPPRVQGTVIVSGTLLDDVRTLEGDLAAPFKSVVPKNKIGGSALLVYEGSFDTRLAAAMGERNLAINAYSDGELSVALVHARRSVELAPESVVAHNALCAVLQADGQFGPALNECYTAERLALQDPLREEPLRKGYLNLIEVRLALLKTQYGASHGSDVVAPPSPHADSK
jgi:4-amino-4-deoxy-L-arabinose transferase-like glycosyltransferase